MEYKILKELKSCAKMEIEVILFYMHKLPELNSQKNSAKVKELLMESCYHLEQLLNEIIHLSKNQKRITPNTLDVALKEEEGMIDIYRYMTKKTKDKKIIKMLRKLAKQELRHSKIVKEFKKDL
jgi:rubrerythrin